MSILIKGMEMPKSCDVCCFDLFVESCPLYNATPEDLVGITWIKKARHRYCPLVPIPPHGRLIDADAFLADMACAVATKMQIEDAPTVIESTIGQLNSDPAVNEAEEGE